MFILSLSLSKKCKWNFSDSCLRWWGLSFNDEHWIFNTFKPFDPIFVLSPPSLSLGFVSSTFELQIWVLSQSLFNSKASVIIFEDWSNISLIEITSHMPLILTYLEFVVHVIQNLSWVFFGFCVWKMCNNFIH